MSDTAELRRLIDNPFSHAFFVSEMYQQNLGFTEARLFREKAIALAETEGDRSLTEALRASAACCEAKLAARASPRLAQPSVVSDRDFEALERKFVVLLRVAAANGIDINVSTAPEPPNLALVYSDIATEILSLGQRGASREDARAEQLTYQALSDGQIAPAGRVARLGLRSTAAVKAYEALRESHSAALKLKNLAVDDLVHALTICHLWVDMRHCEDDAVAPPVFDSPYKTYGEQVTQALLPVMKRIEERAEELEAFDDDVYELDFLEDEKKE